MGVAALAILVWTEGMSDSGGAYTVNVFITFTLSLLGLTVFWWRQRATTTGPARLLLSALRC